MSVGVPESVQAYEGIDATQVEAQALEHVQVTWNVAVPRWYGHL